MLATLPPQSIEVLKYDWSLVGRDKQLAPAGDWRTWVPLAGRGWGKTRCGSEWIRSRVEGKTPMAPGKARRIALIAETAADARDVMIKGDSGILACSPPDYRPTYVANRRALVWPNGVEALIFSAIEPDQLRGPQFDTAWCFVAGTLVDTPTGRVPVESIEDGQLVMTRKGARRVLANGSRSSDVGEVTFSGGQSLVGTPEHPVYTARGWVRMDQLQKGDVVCAINASSGADTHGIGMAKVTTSVAKTESRSACIARFIAKSMGQFLRAMTCITEMMTRRTTIPQIYKHSRDQSTGNCTPRHPVTGQKSRFLRLIARIAGQSCSASEEARLCAEDVSRSGPTLPEQLHAGANTAGLNLPQFVETSAAKVVSTWQPRGRQDVFCLTVDDAPEYFANGILVHNCDELAKWRYAQEAWDMLQMGLRLGNPSQALVTTTPRNIQVLKDIMSDPDTVSTTSSTYENAGNLDPAFRKYIERKYAGTRLGRQEIEAAILDDVQGALWSHANFEKNRARAGNLNRIVVAVDPPATSGENADECGIVVCGVSGDTRQNTSRGYVLEDASIAMASPKEWAERVIEAYKYWGADCIVAEINQGGEMVEAVIRGINPDVPYKPVRAKRGKVARAEPVAALYEQDRVHHVGTHGGLEDQMVHFKNDGLEDKTKSPDRVDALVYALTELMIEPAEAPGLLDVI